LQLASEGATKTITQSNKKRNFWIYIIEVESGNYYTGFTSDLARRYREHLRGSSKYTRSFKPRKIARCWRISGSIGDAMKVERLIKKQSRKKKELFVGKPGQLVRLVDGLAIRSVSPGQVNLLLKGLQ